MNILFRRSKKLNWKFSWLIVFILSAFITNAQTTQIQVDAENKPISEILETLTRDYNFQLSYNSSALSANKLTLHKSFQTPEKTLNYLIKDLPYQIVKSGDVFIITPERSSESVPVQKRMNSVSGQIVEIGSREPLPYTQVLVNGRPILSDQLGNFNFVSASDSVFHLQICHLGYFIKDTVLLANVHHQVALSRTIIHLAQVNIKNNIVEKSALIGTEPGDMQLNHQISKYLPGQGDNSVFTLLRLMPGIQATCEQTNDLVIWGSYEGQSLITFDEFTLFGLRNYNENINVINPFVIKSIEINKGGYEAKYGNRVGGLVNITAKTGSRIKPNFSIILNSSTINGYAEIPLFHRSSLVVAYRQTYYNLYNLDDFNVFAPTHSSQKSFGGFDNNSNVDPDISVYPDKYNFRDFNIKYSYVLRNDDVLSLSYYRGGDVFGLSAETELERTKTDVITNVDPSVDNTVLFNLELNDEEKNRQQGFSSFYHKKWKNGDFSKLIFAYADYSKDEEETVSSFDSNTGDVFVSREDRTTNKALESSLRSENAIFIKNGYEFEFGGGAYLNRTKIGNNNNYTDNSNLDTLNFNETYRAYLFAQQSLAITKKLKFIAGIRANHSFNSQKVVVEPRINVSYKLTDAIKAQASFGLFNQILYKIATVDGDDNYTYLWTTSKDESAGLRATHWIGGLNYTKNNLTINVEGYYKNTNHLTRRYYLQTQVNENINNQYILHSGNARTYGIDTYVRKDFGFNTIWASYSLSKIEERLAANGEPLPGYTLAPHDQRHEFKIASLVNIRNFYISACYVYGSGMNVLKEMFDTQTGIEYNRVDFAVTYSFHWRKMTAETGISILNIFDTQNLTPRNVKTINISEEISPIKVYTDAVPFTPIFFVKTVF